MEPVSSWDPEQQACIDAALNGESFMLMGVGGTGKSTVLKYIINSMRETGKVVALCATTGVAAELIGGEIIHSYLGMGAVSANESYANFIGKIKNNAKACANWRSMDVLAIEEVSMLGAEVLDMLGEAAKDIRRTKLPFGGLQVIMCGDFFQNSPIRRTLEGEDLPPLFAFQSRVYRQIIVKHIELQTIHRQKDEAFQRILSEVRFSCLSDESAAVLRTRVKAAVGSDGIEPTRLYPLNANVEAENEARLTRLGMPIFIFRAIDELWDQRYAKNLENCRYPSVLRLAVGARVMMLSNGAIQGLINGSGGVVEGFSMVHPSGQTVQMNDGSYNASEELYVKVRFKTGVEIVSPQRLEFRNSTGQITATRFQFPLTLAWATTIHKAQGSQMDTVILDPGAIFRPGMFYVALSRVTSLSGLRLESFDKSKISTHPMVLAWYRHNFEGNATKSYIRYLEQLRAEPFVPFTTETAMDFFILFVYKYAPLQSPNKYAPSLGVLIRDFINTFKNNMIFECLI